ncbi:MAG: DUF1295 domain-containing protein [Verrucomicrobiota bacterium]
MSDFWVGLLLVGTVVASLAYLVALKAKLMAIVDLIWTAGLGISGIAYYFAQEVPHARATFVVIILGLWSFRLSYHLLKDRVLRGHEDPRYANLDAHWGAASRRNFYFLFLAQIVFIAIFLYPVTIAAGNPAGGGRVADVLGILIALSALVGESIADRQLAAFRAKPENKGAVCRQGLWRYSRHPNYFFEWLHWWAYVAFAWGAANWWLSLIGPAAMYIFLRYLTGIPHAERSSLKNRGEAYRNYQQTTSAFFPWRPHEPQS